MDKKAFIETNQECYAIDKDDLIEMDKWLDIAHEILSEIFKYENKSLPSATPLVNDIPKLVERLQKNI